MNRNIKLTVILCLVFVAFVFVLTYFRITGNNAVQTYNAEELRELGALVYDEPVEISAFSLVDHNGEVFDQEKLQGVWTLFFFGFTNCPDICPLTLNELSQFYRELETAGVNLDTQVVMVSVDPMRDDTQRLNEYMTSFHPDFIGLNGDYDVIANLAKELFIAHTPPPAMEAMADPHAGHGDAASDDYLIDHSGNILIINSEGLYTGFFDTAIQDDEIFSAYQSIRADY